MTSISAAPTTSSRASPAAVTTQAAAATATANHSKGSTVSSPTIAPKAPPGSSSSLSTTAATEIETTSTLIQNTSSTIQDKNNCGSTILSSVPGRPRHSSMDDTLNTTGGTTSTAVDTTTAAAATVSQTAAAGTSSDLSLPSPTSPNDPSTNHGGSGENISYSAERIIGNGSFGVVFEAKVVETNEVVAIKKVLQDKRFKNRELQIMRQLVKDPHTNIVALKHCFYSQVCYVIMNARLFIVLYSLVSGHARFSLCVCLS